MKKTTKKFEKKQRKKLFFPIFIAIVLVSSILGFIWKDQENADYKKYGGYKFTKIDNKWVTEINEKQIFFDYYPGELENILLPKPPANINTDKIYIAFDPEQEDPNINYILQKISITISNMGTRIILSCIKDSPNCPDIPIINCKDNHLVIQIIKSDQSEVIQQDNCIIFKGNVLYLNRRIDKLRLNLFGIQNEQ